MRCVDIYFRLAICLPLLGYLGKIFEQKSKISNNQKLLDLKHWDFNLSGEEDSAYFQAFASSITGALATTAIFKGVGVGNQVMREIISTLLT